MKQSKDSGIGLIEKLTSGKDYYEIRLESIGGLGANLCGKMLGELGVKCLNLNSSSFSSYGSEKTGTPVKGFIRYCNKEKEIRVHSPVVEPDLLVVFHQALLKDKSVFKGCGRDTAVIIALEPGQEQPEGLRNLETAVCGMGGQQTADCKLEACYGLEAQRIAMETHSRINVVMLGAALKVMGIKSLETGEQICKDTLGKKYPDALKGNLEGMRRGYEEVKRLEDVVEDRWEDRGKENTVEDRWEDRGKENEVENKWEDRGKEDAVERSKEVKGLENEPEHIREVRKLENDTEYSQKVRRGKAEQLDRTDMAVQSSNQTEWGYINAPIGGINPRFGSTVVADLSPSRQGYIPLFIKERCINCGLCHSTCPDMVFQFAKGEYKGKEMMVNQGLDYYHCKGCLRCVDVCPVNALVRGVEAEHPNKEYFMTNQELLRRPEYYEEAGADGYITSESYLTEQRMEGGEV